MTITPELLLLVGSVLFFISMLLGKAGHRFGVPVLLLFLTLGLLVNPSEWINLLVPALIISAFLMFLDAPLRYSSRSPYFGRSVSRINCMSPG